MFSSIDVPTRSHLDPAERQHSLGRYLMTQFTLRPATIADLSEIMRLERAGFAAAIQETEDTFRDRITSFPQGCLVLADTSGKLSGYLCAELWPYATEVPRERFARDHAASATHDPNGQELYISSMVIDPARQGMGLAKRLFSESLAHIRQRFPAVCSAVLIVHPDWKGARQIYRSNGFAQVGVVGQYFRSDGATIDALVMRRGWAAV
ncbi:GNAT family N-acetyltransferase [Pseudoduganella sp. GCM10020061]|uniref:GNAT family N-acetyltransferase n=1 Tax=Pseudoduganella sp. GCM10020061 TaxID=3317345 RepID=UPI003637AF6E